MDEYRPTLLGRALADVLQEMERDGALRESDSDALFVLFDEVMRAEFAAAERSSSTSKKTTAAPNATSGEPLFTHRSMDLRGSASAFNRFMDKWTVQATLDTQSGEALRLDGVPIELPMGTTPAVDLQLKLHDLSQAATTKKRRK